MDLIKALTESLKLGDMVIKIYKTINTPGEGMMTCESYSAPDGKRLQWGLIVDSRYSEMEQPFWSMVIFAADRKDEPEIHHLLDNELPGFFKLLFPDYDWRKDLFEASLRSICRRSTQGKS
jgi:hypothetical protein